jgi:hypothetical protein
MRLASKFAITASMAYKCVRQNNNAELNNDFKIVKSSKKIHRIMLQTSHFFIMWAKIFVIVFLQIFQWLKSP